MRSVLLGTVAIAALTAASAAYAGALPTAGAIAGSFSGAHSSSGGGSAGNGSGTSSSSAGNFSRGGALVTQTGTQFNVVTWSGSGGGTSGGATTTGTGHGGGGQGGVGFGAGVSYLPSSPPPSPPAVSDRRLKQDVTPLGELPNGLKLYSWRYLGGGKRFTGVMAQDLLLDARFYGAVEIADDGLMRVDYARLGMLPVGAEAMAEQGEAAIAAWRARLN